MAKAVLKDLRNYLSIFSHHLQVHLINELAEVSIKLPLNVSVDASEIDSYLKTSGFGLFSIRERLKYIKGYLRLSPSLATELELLWLRH